MRLISNIRAGTRREAPNGSRQNVLDQELARPSEPDCYQFQGLKAEWH